MNTNRTTQSARSAGDRVKRDASQKVPSAAARVKATISTWIATGSAMSRYAGKSGETRFGSPSGAAHAGCPPHAYGFHDGNWWKTRSDLTVRYRSASAWSQSWRPSSVGCNRAGAIARTVSHARTSRLAAEASQNVQPARVDGRLRRSIARSGSGGRGASGTRPLYQLEPPLPQWASPGVRATTS